MALAAAAGRASVAVDDEQFVRSEPPENVGLVSAVAAALQINKLHPAKPAAARRGQRAQRLEHCLERPGTAWNGM